MTKFPNAPQPPRLVLASASPRRRFLLRLMGLDFDVVTSDVDESAIQAPTPLAFAEAAAQAKCLDVFEQMETIPQPLVLGADTVVCIGSNGEAPATSPRARLLGKPADAREAREMLRHLGGRFHEVVTAVAIARRDTAGCATVQTGAWSSRVRFHPLDDECIAAYVATGESLDKAGAYAVQGAGASLIAEIDGDLSNVIGLPLGLVVEMLAPEYGDLVLPQDTALLSRDAL